MEAKIDLAETMAAEAVTKQLYDAATMGEVATFQTLVQQDPFLVDQVSFSRSRNLLHIATMAGQLGIVEELLRINPKLARDVDSNKSSSLHIAAEQGHVEIVNKLLSVAPKMCWWLDDQGMNPVHIAAMRGHVEILKVLVEYDLSPARERLHRGQTVLHLCAKHGQVRTLKFLVKKLDCLVRVKDEDGETLHDLALRCVRVKDEDGETLHDLALRCDQDEMKDYLIGNHTIPSSYGFLGGKEVSDMTMVVVGLVAAMAFSAAVSPPGGLWQDDTSSHRAGKAVMASSHPKLYKHFSRANTTAFVSSLLVIFLRTLDATNNAIIFLAVIWYATMVAMASIGVSYGASVIITNPAETQRVDLIIAILSAGFVGIFQLVIGSLMIASSYSTWKTLKLHYRDLTSTDRIFRKFYQSTHSDWSNSEPIMTIIMEEYVKHRDELLGRYNLRRN